MSRNRASSRSRTAQQLNTTSPSVTTPANRRTASSVASPRARGPSSSTSSSSRLRSVTSSDPASPISRQSVTSPGSSTRVQTPSTTHPQTPRRTLAAPIKSPKSSSQTLRSSRNVTTTSTTSSSSVSTSTASSAPTPRTGSSKPTLSSSRKAVSPRRSSPLPSLPPATVSSSDTHNDSASSSTASSVHTTGIRLNIEEDFGAAYGAVEYREGDDSVDMFGLGATSFHGSVGARNDSVTAGNTVEGVDAVYGAYGEGYQGEDDSADMFGLFGGDTSVQMDAAHHRNDDANALDQGADAMDAADTVEYTAQAQSPAPATGRSTRASPFSALLARPPTPPPSMSRQGSPTHATQRPKSTTQPLQHPRTPPSAHMEVANTSMADYANDEGVSGQYAYQDADDSVDMFGLGSPDVTQPPSSRRATPQRQTPRAAAHRRGVESGKTVASPGRYHFRREETEEDEGVALTSSHTNATPDDSSDGDGVMDMTSSHLGLGVTSGAYQDADDSVDMFGLGSGSFHGVADASYGGDAVDGDVGYDGDAVYQAQDDSGDLFGLFGGHADDGGFLDALPAPQVDAGDSGEEDASVEEEMAFMQERMGRGASASLGGGAMGDDDDGDVGIATVDEVESTSGKRRMGVVNESMRSGVDVQGRSKLGKGIPAHGTSIFTTGTGTYAPSMGPGTRMSAANLAKYAALQSPTGAHAHTQMHGQGQGHSKATPARAGGFAMPQTQSSTPQTQTHTARLKGHASGPQTQVSGAGKAAHLGSPLGAAGIGSTTTTGTSTGAGPGTGVGAGTNVGLHYGKLTALQSPTGAGTGVSGRIGTGISTHSSTAAFAPPGTNTVDHVDMNASAPFAPLSPLPAPTITDNHTAPRAHPSVFFPSPLTPPSAALASAHKGDVGVAVAAETEAEMAPAPSPVDTLIAAVTHAANECSVRMLSYGHQWLSTLAAQVSDRETHISGKSYFPIPACVSPPHIVTTLSLVQTHNHIRAMRTLLATAPTLHSVFAVPQSGATQGMRWPHNDAIATHSRAHMPSIFFTPLPQPTPALVAEYPDAFEPSPVPAPTLAAAAASSSSVAYVCTCVHRRNTNQWTMRQPRPWAVTSDGSALTSTHQKMGVDPHSAINATAASVRDLPSCLDVYVYLTLHLRLHTLSRRSGAGMGAGAAFNPLGHGLSGAGVLDGTGMGVSSSAGIGASVHPATVLEALQRMHAHTAHVTASLNPHITSDDAATTSASTPTPYIPILCPYLLSLHAHLTHSLLPTPLPRPHSFARARPHTDTLSLLSLALQLQPFCRPAWSLLARAVRSRRQLWSVSLPAHWFSRIGIAETLAILPVDAVTDRPTSPANTRTAKSARGSSRKKPTSLNTSAAMADIDEYLLGEHTDTTAAFTSALSSPWPCLCEQAVCPVCDITRPRSIVGAVHAAAISPDLRSLLLSLAPDFAHTTMFAELLLVTAHSRLCVTDDYTSSAGTAISALDCEPYSLEDAVLLSHTLLDAADPWYSPAWPVLASAYLRCGRPDELGALSHRALRVNPYSYECCYITALLQMALGQWATAQSWLVRAIRLVTGSPTASAAAPGSAQSNNSAFGLNLASSVTTPASANPNLAETSTSFADIGMLACPAPALLLAQCRIALGDAVGAAQWAASVQTGTYALTGGVGHVTVAAAGSAVGAGSAELLGKVMEARKLHTHALFWYKRALAASGEDRHREDVERVSDILAGRSSKRQRR